MRNDEPEGQMRISRPDELVLGARTGSEIAPILDMVRKFTSHVACRDPLLADLHLYEKAHNGYYPDHHNGGVPVNRYDRALRKMEKGAFIFDKPIWAILLGYEAVYRDAAWDVEARYTSETRDGDSDYRMSERPARYVFTRVGIMDDPAAPGRLEEELSALEARLWDLDAATATLAAWAASGLHMAVTCRHCGPSRERRTTFLSQGQIMDLAKRFPDLESLRARFRCHRCGHREPYMDACTGT